MCPTQASRLVALARPQLRATESFGHQDRRKKEAAGCSKGARPLAPFGGRRTKRASTSSTPSRPVRIRGLEGHVTHHAGPEVALVEEENLQGRCRARRTPGSLPRGCGGSAAADRGDGRFRRRAPMTHDGDKRECLHRRAHLARELESAHAVRSNPGVQPPGDKDQQSCQSRVGELQGGGDAAARSFHRAGPLVSVPHSRDSRRRRLATEQPAQELVYEVSHVSGRFALYAARTPNWICHF